MASRGNRRTHFTMLAPSLQELLAGRAPALDRWSAGAERRADFSETLTLAGRHTRFVGLFGFKHTDARSQSGHALKCPKKGCFGRKIFTRNAVVVCFIGLGGEKERKKEILKL